MPLRLVLSERAKEAISFMMKEIKTENPEASISASSLAEWIILNFHQSGFKTGKKKIIRDHFNIKAFARAKLSTLNSISDFENFYKQLKEQTKLTKGKSERKTKGE